MPNDLLIARRALAAETPRAPSPIHVINVSHGDSVLVVNRDLPAVKAAIEAKALTAPADPIDYMPFAIQHGVPLTTSVKAAMLVDVGSRQFGEDVVSYLQAQGVLDAVDLWAERLVLVASHIHEDHIGGLTYLEPQIRDGGRADRKQDLGWTLC